MSGHDSRLPRSPGRRRVMAAGAAMAASALLPRGLSAAARPGSSPALALLDLRYADMDLFSGAAASFAAPVLALEEDVVAQWHRGLGPRLVQARPRILALGSYSDLQLLQSLTRPLGYRLGFHSLHAAGNAATSACLHAAQGSCFGAGWAQSMRALLGRHPRNADIYSWVLTT